MNVQEILEALSSSDIVLETSIIILILEPGRQALRANGATLIIFLKAIEWCGDGIMHPIGRS
jgi:hypothetical protein